MNIKELQVKERRYPKVLSVRISEMDYNFIKKNKIIPGKLFRWALKEIDKNKKEKQK